MESTQKNIALQFYLYQGEGVLPITPNQYMSGRVKRENFVFLVNLLYVNHMKLFTSEHLSKQHLVRFESTYLLIDR